MADGGTTPMTHDGWLWDLAVPGNNDHDFYVSPASGDVAASMLQSAWTDPASGKDLMGARWYAPSAGDFTSADTVQVSPDPDPAAGDPFAYAADNPLTYTDPTGHLISAGSPATNPNYQADTAYANVFTQTYQRAGVTQAKANAAKAAAAVTAAKKAAAQRAKQQAAARAAAKKQAEEKAQATARQRAEKQALALTTLNPRDKPAPAGSGAGTSKKSKPPLTTSCPAGSADALECYGLNFQHDTGSSASTGKGGNRGLLGVCQTGEGFVTISGCGTINSAATGDEERSGGGSKSPGASGDDPGGLPNPPPMSRMERVGSGLKDDLFHRAASWEVDNAAAQEFTITGGDGVDRDLYQVQGELNGKPGIYEWIVDRSGSEPLITHQRFIPGGRITGGPNQ